MNGLKARIIPFLISLRDKINRGESHKTLNSQI
jgi:hypothetical protein